MTTLLPSVSSRCFQAEGRRKCFFFSLVVVVSLWGELLAWLLYIYMKKKI